jgi:hypothetical protein
VTSPGSGHQPTADPTESLPLNGRSWWTGRHLTYLAAAFLGLVVLVGAVLTTLQTLDTGPGTGACAFQHVDPVQVDPGSITLGPRTPTQVVNVVFGASRDAQTATVDFQSQQSLPIGRGMPMHAYIGEFARTDGYRFPSSAPNPPDNTTVPIAASAAVAGRATVRMTVCVDPAGPHRAAPGTYVGTVALDDDALTSPVVATLSVSLKYEDPYGPLVLTLLAVVAATYLAALADPAPKPFRAWFQDHEHLSAIAFAAAAALAAYGATYLRSPDWGAAGLLAVGALFAATFTAAAAGITAHAAGKNAAQSSKPTP